MIRAILPCWCLAGQTVARRSHCRGAGDPWVVVPRYPGMTSAAGLVVADIVHNFVQTADRAVPGHASIFNRGL